MMNHDKYFYVYDKEISIKELIKIYLIWTN
jgi:hypothetical protein